MMQILAKDKMLMEDAFDEAGNLRPGVKIIDPVTNQCVAEGRAADVPANENFKPGDPLYLGDKVSGDYCELRDILRQPSRHALIKHLGKLDKRRIILAREHLLQLAAYHPGFRETTVEIVLMICRIMGGDEETDLKMTDDAFYNSGGDSDPDE